MGYLANALITAIVGNAANQVFPDQAYLDEVYEVQNGYTQLFYDHYGTEFPFWDETAMFSVLDPSNVLNSTTCMYLKYPSYAPSPSLIPIFKHTSIS